MFSHQCTRRVHNYRGGRFPNVQHPRATRSQVSRRSHPRTLGTAHHPYLPEGPHGNRPPGRRPPRGHHRALRQGHRPLRRPARRSRPVRAHRRHRHHVRRPAWLRCSPRQAGRQLAPRSRIRSAQPWA